MLYKVIAEQGNFIVELRDRIPLLAPPGKDCAWDVIQDMLPPGTKIQAIEQPKGVWVRV